MVRWEEIDHMTRPGQRLLRLLAVSAVLNLIAATVNLVNVTNDEHAWLFTLALALHGIAGIFLVLFFTGFRRSRQRPPRS